MKVNVFTSGEDGYHTYRIPAVLAAANGTLLAFCESRRNSREDHGDIDLLVKRVAKSLHEGPAAYSCLVTLPENDVGCLYEAGFESPYEHIVFERFRLN